MRKLAKTELEEYPLAPKEAPVVATQKIVEPVETAPPAPPAQQARQKPRRSRGKKTLELPLRPSKEAVLSKLSPPRSPYNSPFIDQASDILEGSLQARLFQSY